MTELKTLKDLYSEDSTWNMGEMISEKELKAEAVKWYLYTMDMPSFNEVSEDLAIAKFIKQFFNLTEADLGEEKK